MSTQEIFLQLIPGASLAEPPGGQLLGRKMGQEGPIQCGDVGGGHGSS